MEFASFAQAIGFMKSALTFSRTFSADITLQARGNALRLTGADPSTSVAIDVPADIPPFERITVGGEELTAIVGRMDAETVGIRPAHNAVTLTFSGGLEATATLPATHDARDAHAAALLDEPSAEGWRPLPPFLEAVQPFVAKNLMGGWAENVVLMQYAAGDVAIGTNITFLAAAGEVSLLLTDEEPDALLLPPALVAMVSALYGAVISHESRFLYVRGTLGDMPVAIAYTRPAAPFGGDAVRRVTAALMEAAEAGVSYAMPLARWKRLARAVSPNVATLRMKVSPQYVALNSSAIDGAAVHATVGAYALGVDHVMTALTPQALAALAAIRSDSDDDDVVITVAETDGGASRTIVVAAPGMFCGTKMSRGITVDEDE